MTKLFRNSSPNALTRQQAVVLEKKRMQERREAAQQLANEGRGEDTEVAHVARGEIVLPRVLQSPEVMEALARAASAHNIPLGRLLVGNARNSINPNTGVAEFGIGDWFSEVFGKEQNGTTSASTPRGVVLPHIDKEDATTSYADLDFDPRGPGLAATALAHPIAAISAYRAGRQAEREEAENQLGLNTPNDGGDAWRHARGSQLLTNSVGPEIAKKFTDAYERHRVNPEGERLMDLYNNHAGRILAGDSNSLPALQSAVGNGYLRTRVFPPRLK